MEYPAVLQRAKAENAVIFWGDETGVTNRENHERGFAPRGQTPIVTMESKQERMNMISAISADGMVRFMLYEDNMTQQRLLAFMRRLAADSKRKIFLILDNLKVHHGKIVAAWLEKHQDKIEVFFLPPYSPELNPDEYLNHALKRDVHSGCLPVSTQDISHKIRSFLGRLQRNPGRVSAFFHHPAVSYISMQK